MRVKVLKPFKDKYTGTIHQKGHEIDVTQERYEELISAASGPFVEQIEPPEPPPTRIIKDGKKPKSGTKK